MRLLFKRSAELGEEILPPEEEPADVAAREVRGTEDFGKLGGRNGLAVVPEEGGPDFVLQVLGIREAVGIAPGAAQAVDVLALGMIKLGLGGVAIGEDIDAEMQGDEDLPLGVGEPGAVAECRAQLGQPMEEAALALGIGEVFRHRGGRCDGPGLPADEMDEHAAGSDELRELQDGIGLRLREVGLMNDVQLTALERLLQTEPHGPEVGGGAGEEEIAWGGVGLGTHDRGRLAAVHQAGGGAV